MPDLPNLANPAYTDRINRAIDHITRSIAQPLKLEDVAAVAGFSPYHFHRIFKARLGETLNAFIRRVRLERAIHMIWHNRDISLTEVALACGFSSSSDFSRNFRNFYGLPPSAFDLDKFRASGREQMLQRLKDAVDTKELPPQPEISQNLDGFEVQLRELPPRRVAYLRVLNPYEGDGVTRAYEQLMNWAKERGLEHGQWLGYQWEDPEIVPLEKCRYDVGLEIPDSADVDEDISVTEFDAMTVAELEMKGSIELEMRALQWIYTSWLPASGMAPDHQPGFEAWNGLPFAHGMEHFDLKLQLPVVKIAPKVH